MVFDLDLGSTAGRALGIVIGATVVLLVIAEVLPELFTATGDINNVFANNASDLNNSAAANIAGVMPIIIGILVVFLVVGLIAGFIQRRRNGGV